MRTLFSLLLPISLITVPIIAKESKDALLIEQRTTANFVSELLAQEYLSYLSQTRHEKGREKIAKSPESVNPWIHGAYALLSAKQYDYLISVEADLQKTLEPHQAILRKNKRLSTKLDAIFTKGDLQSLDLFRTAVEKSLPKDHQDWWKALSEKSGTLNNLCEDKKIEKKHLSKEKAFAYASGLKEIELSCFLSALSEAKEERLEAIDAGIHFLGRMRQNSAPAYNARQLKLLHAFFLLQKKDYAETLRILADLQASEPTYRLFYEVTQRVFALSSRGSGEVSLKN